MPFSTTLSLPFSCNNGVWCKNMMKSNKEHRKGKQKGLDAVFYREPYPFTFIQPVTYNLSQAFIREGENAGSQK